MNSKQYNIDRLAEAKPFVRAAAAFLLCLCRGWNIELCYEVANKFLDTLEEDLGAIE